MECHNYVKRQLTSAALIVSLSIAGCQTTSLDTSKNSYIQTACETSNNLISEDFGIGDLPGVLVLDGTSSTELLAEFSRDLDADEAIQIAIGVVRQRIGIRLVLRQSAQAKEHHPYRKNSSHVSQFGHKRYALSDQRPQPWFKTGISSMVRVGSSRFLRYPRLTVMLLCPITCCSLVSEPVLWKTSMAPVCLNE